MIIAALLIGAILIVAAVRNSQGALFSALGQDVPGFVIWAAAIFAVGAIGFVPNLKPVSRGLLALILVVLILRNYQAIFSGFQNAWQNPPAYTPGTNDKSGTTGTAAQPAGNTGSSGSLLSGMDFAGSAANAIGDIFGSSNPGGANSVTGGF